MMPVVFQGTSGASQTVLAQPPLIQHPSPALHSPRGAADEYRFFAPEELLALIRADVEASRLEAALRKLKFLIAEPNPPVEALAIAGRVYAELRLAAQAQDCYRRYLSSQPLLQWRAGGARRPRIGCAQATRSPAALGACRQPLRDARARADEGARVAEAAVAIRAPARRRISQAAASTAAYA